MVVPADDDVFVELSSDSLDDEDVEDEIWVESDEVDDEVVEDEFFVSWPRPSW